jgi:hypothetical protein
MTTGYGDTFWSLFLVAVAVGWFVWYLFHRTKR